jgi:hypothetical protein
MTCTLLCEEPYFRSCKEGKYRVIFAKSSQMKTKQDLPLTAEEACAKVADIYDSGIN